MNNKRWQQKDRSGKAQFGLRLVMMIMAVFAIAATVIGGLLRKEEDRFLFVVFGLTAPVAMMIILSLLISLKPLRNSPPAEKSDFEDMPETSVSPPPEEGEVSNPHPPRNYIEREKNKFRDKYS